MTSWSSSFPLSGGVIVPLLVFLRAASETRLLSRWVPRDSSKRVRKAGGKTGRFHPDWHIGS